MPIEILRTNRRNFLATSLATGAWCAWPNLASAAPTREAHRFALLADTHIHAAPTFESRGVNMTNLLRTAVSALVAREQPFAAAMILGDCAYLDGQTDDYKQLGKELAPLLEKDWAVHLALGNHDHREHCLAAFPGDKDNLYAKVERRVAVVPAERGNWFLLDSLDKVNNTPGKLGETQLAWLAEALDRHADKPALIGVHHNPLSDVIAMAGKPAGILDTEAFFKVIDSRRHVKAVFFGHTHAWSVVEHAGIHLVNLPPVAYTFNKDKPNGWVECELQADRAILTMHCHNPERPEHGKPLNLVYRKG
jgi:3',5'-cyclic AMP phosphodiesterase CpdA